MRACAARVLSEVQKITTPHPAEAGSPDGKIDRRRDSSPAASTFYTAITKGQGNFYTANTKSTPTVRGSPRPSFSHQSDSRSFLLRAPLVSSLLRPLSRKLPFQPETKKGLASCVARPPGFTPTPQCGAKMYSHHVHLSAHSGPSSNVRNERVVVRRPKATGIRVPVSHRGVRHRCTQLSLPQEAGT